MPLLIGIIVVIVIAVVAVIIAGHKKSSAPAAKPQTSISTTANTTAQNTTKESTTESTTQTTTTTTEATTKNNYSKVLSNTMWYYYFDETDQYSYLEFLDEHSLHYYQQDGYTSIINEELWADYEIEGNELTIHTSGTNETQIYKIKITISDMNNLHGMDCIKIQGEGTINPVEYYFGG